MSKLDPNATTDIKLGNATFRYKVLSVREWLRKQELHKPDDNGEVSWGNLADAAAFGLVAIEGADIAPTSDGLMDGLSIGELIHLTRESLDACAMVGAEKKDSGSPA